MADIDFFKRLNDSAGHAAGDVCIQRVAQTIEQALRHDEDAVFRYGGEEFLIVFKHVTADLAVSLAERIRQAVEALAIPNPGIASAGGRSGVVTLSIGVAFGRDGVGPERVIKWSDDALYEAKRAGRNRVLLFTADGRDAPSIIPPEPSALSDPETGQAHFAEANGPGSDPARLAVFPTEPGILPGCY
jgi:diguanylate cyclase (GGDEF)-like protein